MTQNLPSTAASQALTPLGLAPKPAQNPDRHWTRAKQAEFLRLLASSHCVARAAKQVGMSRQSAYRLRNRLKGEPFDIAWAAAFRRQFDALAQAALERALGGVEVPHYYKGELVGTHRVYDERLTVALLAMQDRLTPIAPDVYAEQRDFEAHDFDALVERVETGEELWKVGPGEGGDEGGVEAGGEDAGEAGV